MKNFTKLLSSLVAIIGFGAIANAQCPVGQMNVTVDVTTDDWGYEAYWEITPTGNACGVGTLVSYANAGVVGCAGGGALNAAGGDPGAYANNTTINEIVGCLPAGVCYDLHYVDDYADGGATFQIYLDGVATDFFTGTGAGNTFTFCVNAPAAIDVAMSSTNEEYTLVPLTQVTALGTNGVLTNVGAGTVTNANMTVNVYNGLMANVYTGTSNTVPSILAGASANVTAIGFTPSLVDVYTVELISNIAEVDGNLTNDTVYSTYVVTDSIYARDNGVVAGTIGIGAGTTGQLGQSFDIVTTDDITSVSMFIGNNNLAMSGQPLSATVFATDAMGTPTTALVSTTIVTVDTTTNSMWTLPIVGGSYTMAPGEYVVVVNEGDSNVTIGLSDNIFTLASTWVLFGANPWTNNEGYGINQTYVLRPNFGPVACVPTASTVTDAACITYTWPQSGATYTTSGMYNDTVLNAMGCDSIITLDLTINVPTTATQTVSSCEDYTWAVDANVYTTTGMYTAVIPNAAGCDSTITLDLTIGAIDNTVSELNNVITANQAGATYQWIDCGDGNAIIPGENGQSYMPAANGDYAVIVVSGTCVDTSACTAITTIGIGETAFSAGIDIYPNPSNGKFTITVNDLPIGSLDIEVLDARGRILLTKTATLENGNANIQIELNDVESGIYFVNLKSGDQSVIERIVVSKN